MIVPPPSDDRRERPVDPDLTRPDHEPGDDGSVPAAPDRSPGDITRDSYQQAADLYAERTPRTSSTVHAPFLDRIAGLVAGGRLPELGSGPGWDANYLQARGLTVTRSDATPHSLTDSGLRGARRLPSTPAMTISAGPGTVFSPTLSCCT